MQDTRSDIVQRARVVSPRSTNFLDIEVDNALIEGSDRPRCASSFADRETFLFLSNDRSLAR